MTIILFRYLHPFLGTLILVRLAGGFSHLMAQMTCSHAQIAFWGFVHIATHLGDQIPQNPIFGV